MLPASISKRVITRFVQIFKTLPEVFKCGKMDFFQGISPPNFISFSLDNQTGEESQTQTNTPSDTPIESLPAAAPVSAPNIARGLVPSPPPFPPTRPLKLSITSTNHPEVISSNNGGFRPLEKSLTPQQSEGQDEETTGGVERQDSVSMPKDVLPVETTTATTSLLFRTSTPTQNLAGTSEELNLSQLEKGLTIASSSRTVLPELLSVVVPAVEVSTPSFLRPEIDDGSSSCDVPRLPTGEAKVRFLDDSTGAEEAGDTSSQACGPPLYGFVPTGTASKGLGEESSTTAFDHIPDSFRPSTSAAHDPAIPELSGRSRAILKQYFDEDATTISFPLGHRTVAFTEPQIYHLLRILTDETLRMSYETMERMVIGAIKGAPITSESRTGHFKLRQRAQTPGPGQQEESSDSSRDASHSGFGTDTSDDAGTGGEERELGLFNDSDSSGEMALISQAFKEPCIPTPIARDTPTADSTNEGFESAGRSSLDATLSELRDRPTQTKPPVTSSGKAPKKKKRGQTRGIPMKEEFFSKIGWTRSFISGPADPFTTLI